MIESSEMYIVDNAVVNLDSNTFLTCNREGSYSSCVISEDINM